LYCNACKYYKLGLMEQRVASLMPASFLKQLFVQSEVESRNFAEVSRVLHLAVEWIPQHTLCLVNEKLLTQQAQKGLKFACIWVI